MLRLEHFCNQRSAVCGSSMHSGHVGSTARSNKSAYALSSGVWPGRKPSRTMEPTRFEVALRSTLQETSSCTMAVRGLLIGRSAMLHQKRAFAVTCEMSRGGMPVVAAAAFTRFSEASSCWRICVALWMVFSRNWFSENIVKRSMGHLADAQSGARSRAAFFLEPWKT